ncbi:complex I subunit 1 family protein [Oceanithermus sp.]|uniref:complex I subunit 1/NuoH family protein n=1 Tax=Oceanithermus sp. TaxID=2268145 RepID=UPI0025EFA746|nr:complex I subunit 1 family protein [Oceanithermus sp.]
MTYLITALKGLVLILMLLFAFAYLTWAMRRVLARFQIRLGPNRVGPLGLLQPIADAVKAIFKEDISVSKADKFVYWLAPVISFTFALAAFAVIPLGPEGSLFGLDPWVADLNLGVLYIFAVAELAVYGIFLSGWASGSKYSLLGGLRSAAGLVGYELALGIALLGPVLLVGSLSLRDIVEWQGEHGWLILWQFPAFVVYLIAALAEMGRTPFDFVEAEQELVGGFSTEYNSMKFVAFYMAELLHWITAAALIPTLFLGGWHAPFGLPDVPILWLFVKWAVFVFLVMWIWASWFRTRYDVMIRFAWGVLFPVALAWFLATAYWVASKGGAV